MKTVCGLDVHKDSVFCCILCANGEKIQHKFGVLTEDLVTLRDLMVSEGVEECAMESTSIYWIPVWRVLEGSVKLHLVNPYFIKQLPGKKSDVKDAEWIAACLSKELIASSFVPDDKIQRLRQYDRRIFDLNASISRNLVKRDQCIQRCNIRISNYISTTDSKGYRSIVKLISQGVTDAEVLVKELHGRTINRHGRETLVRALSGVVSETDIDIINQLDDGFFKADNNAAERAMRPCKLGMNNYLFFGNHASARRGAIIYTVVESCKLNNVNVFEYLTDLFSREPKFGETYKDFLPNRWKK